MDDLRSLSCSETLGFKFYVILKFSLMVRYMLWIQLFNLRIEYYDVSVLVVLTTTVGKSVKMDIQTIDTFRGKFAQDCAKINLNPTMVGSVWF